MGFINLTIAILSIFDLLVVIFIMIVLLIMVFASTIGPVAWV